MEAQIRFTNQKDHISCARHGVVETKSRVGGPLTPPRGYDTNLNSEGSSNLGTVGFVWTSHRSPVFWPPFDVGKVLGVK